MSKPGPAIQMQKLHQYTETSMQLQGGPTKVAQIIISMQPFQRYKVWKKVQPFAGPPCKIIVIKWADAVTCEAWNGPTCRSVTNRLRISEKLSAYNDVLAAFYYDSH